MADQHIHQPRLLITIIKEDQAKLAEIRIVQELPEYHSFRHHGDPGTLLDVLALLADAKSDNLWWLLLVRLLLLAVSLGFRSFDGFLGRH